MSLPHTALAPSGQPIWLDMARGSARALVAMQARGLATRDILTDAAVRNAMVVHAAFGGSTNLLLHSPPSPTPPACAVRPSTTGARSTAACRGWSTCCRTGRSAIRPCGCSSPAAFPRSCCTCGGLGLLDLECLTVSGERLGRVLDWWEGSERRVRLRERLTAMDGVDPDDVIMAPAEARRRGLTSTVTFPRGNLAPEGSVIKSTAIDPSVVDADGVYRKTGPARVFTRERDAIAAIKSQKPDRLKPGDILVLICRGPLGAGMEEIYQITAALKHLSWGKQVAVLTDARFSGVSTGACIGHVGPEALAGGPIGTLRDGDRIQIVVDRNRLEGTVDLVGEGDARFSPEQGARVLAARAPRPDLAADPDIAADTRLWAALQQAGGGTWGGCVYDVDAITRAIERGK